MWTERLSSIKLKNHFLQKMILSVFNRVNLTFSCIKENLFFIKDNYFMYNNSDIIIDIGL